MLKAKDFWKYICEDFNYRLFSGVPCISLKPLYDTMNSKFMHYMPATNDIDALSLINGARLSDTKGAILINSNKVFDIYNSIQYLNIEYGIPLLMLIYNESKLPNIKCTKGGIKDIDKIINKIDSTGTIGIVLINDGDLI